MRKRLCCPELPGVSHCAPLPKGSHIDGSNAEGLSYEVPAAGFHESCKSNTFNFMEQYNWTLKTSEQCCFLFSFFLAHHCKNCTKSMVVAPVLQPFPLGGLKWKGNQQPQRNSAFFCWEGCATKMLTLNQGSCLSWNERRAILEYMEKHHILCIFVGMYTFLYAIRYMLHAILFYNKLHWLYYYFGLHCATLYIYIYTNYVCISYTCGSLNTRKDCLGPEIVMQQPQLLGVSSAHVSTQVVLQNRARVTVQLTLIIWWISKTAWLLTHTQCRTETSNISWAQLQ